MDQPRTPKHQPGAGQFAKTEHQRNGLSDLRYPNIPVLPLTRFEQIYSHLPQ